MITDPIEPYPGAWNQTRPDNAPAVVDADGRSGGGEGVGTGETATAESAGYATGGVYTGPPIEFEDGCTLVLPARDPERMAAVLARGVQWLGVGTASHLARIVELERQRDQVLALCEQAERGEPEAIFRSGPEWASCIRAIYGGGS